MGSLPRVLSVIIAALPILLASCTEDPVPIYISGNPRLELVRDSVVVLGQSGEEAVITAVYVTPMGESYAAGFELKPSNIFNQGNIWKHDGENYVSVLDPAARDLVLWVLDIHAAPTSRIWAVAHLKEILPTRTSAVLRQDGAAWVDVSPDVLVPVNGCHVVSDDNVWVYGRTSTLYHYQSASWETLSLPVDSLGTDDIEVISVVGNPNFTFVLANVRENADSTGRALLQYSNGNWSILYKEGALKDASPINRGLNSLMLSNEGALHALGDAVYRWDGSKLISAFRISSGVPIVSGTVSPSGSLLAVGGGLTAVWTEGASWHNVHIEAPERSGFADVGMNDSLVVIAGYSEEIVEDSLKYSDEMYRGILRKVEK